MASTGRSSRASAGTLAGALRTIRDIPTGRPALTEERRQQLSGAPFERERAAARSAGLRLRGTKTPSRPQDEQNPVQKPRQEETATPDSGTAPLAQPGEPTPEATTAPPARAGGPASHADAYANSHADADAHPSPAPTP